MGKKKRLNKFITKWIKSDLPEERSTVLLLGVTRIPTSPVPARRPCSLPLNPTIPNHHHPQRRNPRRRIPTPGSDAGEAPDPVQLLETCSNNNTPPYPAMDRSVDSIGTCSLDVDASAELSDFSENSSAGTLRSFSLKSPAPQEARLPSYLSLACTVNGYSATTNYDPERLAKSRDASPHRPSEPPHDPAIYAIHNNLLSPPNLVPLPLNLKKYKMAEPTITHQHEQFYRCTKSVSTYLSSETHLYTTDTVDACLETKFQNGNSKQEITTEATNGDAKSYESKSFIQQRVERLYGPGALAQGFLVMKRHKTKSSTNSEFEDTTEDVKNITLPAKPVQHEDIFFNKSLKQSRRSLPVLRHLTPEFTAQLPIFNSRKGGETPLLKSNTVPILKMENGDGVAKPAMNGHQITNNNTAVVKDGHYFLKVLDTEATRLLALADRAEEYLLEEELNENAKGIVRSTSGKAKLLVSQKMQQFKGLCTNNITQVEGEAFPTTNEDLEGFWDMVMLQVDQVDSLFVDLEELKSNNWIEVKKPVDTVDKPCTNKKQRVGVTAAAAAARAQNPNTIEIQKVREVQRKKMLEDRRKAMRELKQGKRQSIEILMPETS